MIISHIKPYLFDLVVCHADLSQLGCGEDRGDGLITAQHIVGQVQPLQAREATEVRRQPVEVNGGRGGEGEGMRRASVMHTHKRIHER